MPYCEPCEQYHAPSALDSDGNCPTCGKKVEAVADNDDGSDDKAPWHFKLLVAGVVVYLGWRTLQLVGVMS